MSIVQQLLERLRPLLEENGGKFRALTTDDQPYYFVKWAFDENYLLCLYYGITAKEEGKRDNKKRVPAKELANAIRVCAHKWSFDRADFDDCCPVARSAGPCGFAVVGRCMELLGVAEHDPAGHCFTLVNTGRAIELLREE